MKDLSYLDEYRLPLMGFLGDKTNGMFKIPFGNKFARIIASDGDNWDHVSVSLEDKNGKMIERCPKWNEMCAIKDIFFEEDEEVMQLHPKKEDYVDIHPYCLHLWRPQKEKIPTPPSYMVGYTKKYTKK